MFSHENLTSVAWTQIQQCFDAYSKNGNDHLDRLEAFLTGRKRKRLKCWIIWVLMCRLLLLCCNILLGETMDGELFVLVFVYIWCLFRWYGFDVTHGHTLDQGVICWSSGTRNICTCGKQHVALCSDSSSNAFEYMLTEESQNDMLTYTLGFLWTRRVCSSWTLEFWAQGNSKAWWRDYNLAPVVNIKVNINGSWRHSHRFTRLVQTKITRVKKASDQHFVQPEEMVSVKVFTVCRR